MKILITGKMGFIGSHLIENLSVEYDVISTSRNELELSNPDQVCEFLTNNKFDLIINTATTGGKTGNIDGPETLYNNLAITFNLLKFKHPNTKIFNFTSGYELDKNIDHSGDNSNFIDYYPLDYYGMSKNIISRIHNNHPDVYTFRLFGVYGEYEKDNRFIKRSIIKYINHQPLIVVQDRYLDFIYIDDIIKVIKYYIKNINNKLDHFIDITSPKKYSLVETINIINNLDKHKVEVIINEEGMGLGYIGNGKQFSQIIPDYITLEEGIKNVYNYINKIL